MATLFGSLYTVFFWKPTSLLYSVNGGQITQLGRINIEAPVAAPVSVQPGDMFDDVVYVGTAHVVAPAHEQQKSYSNKNYDIEMQTPSAPRL
jgi:outer membrane protein assembly factor BamB